MITATLTLIALLGTGGEGDKKKPIPKTATVELSLKTDVAAKGTTLLVRDIADVRTADPELTKRILEFDIGRPPQPGYTRSINRTDLTLRLMRAGIKQAAIKFSGGTQAYVQPATHNLNAAELTTAAERVLDRAILRSEHPDVTYKLRSRLATQRVPRGRTSRELVARVKDGRLGYSHAHIAVDVVIDGEVYRTIPVYYSLTRHYKVLALAYGVHPGTVLNESNLVWKRIESNHGVAQYVTSYDQVRGKTARTRLQRGMLLTHRNLGVQSVIRSGDIVELVINSGMVKVRTKVRAMDDGHIGKFIRVVRLKGLARRGRQLNANSVLVAKVDSSSSVVIESK